MTYNGYVVVWRPGRRRGTYVGAVYHDLADFPSEPLHLTTGRSNYRYALRAAQAWVDRQRKKEPTVECPKCHSRREVSVGNLTHSRAIACDSCGVCMEVVSDGS